MLSRLSIDVERARIVAETPPGIQCFLRTDRIAIHGGPVGQQTKHRKPRQKTGSDGPIRLLIPPGLRDLMRDVALNQQWEKDVSVRDTRHSDA
jgi:hypothetical protein